MNKFLAALAVAAVMLLVAVVVVSCADGAGRPAVCATYTDAAGQWWEEDGEPVDDDPCDTDDVWELDKPKKQPTKPAVKPQPRPRVTRR